MRQLVYAIFISNNHPSFPLWWNENLVKHQKVSKYYETDCTSYGGTGFLVTTKAEITFKLISERISILTTTMKKTKYCFISVYALTNESTIKYPEKKSTFYEHLPDIISNVNRNVLIIIEGDFNAKNKMRHRDQQDHWDINKKWYKWKRRKTDRALHSTSSPGNQYFLQTQANTSNYMDNTSSINNSTTKLLQKNPYRNQIDYIIARHCETIKMTDLKSTTNKITMSDHKPVVMKTTITFKKHGKKVRYSKSIIGDWGI